MPLLARVSKSNTRVCMCVLYLRKVAPLVTHAIMTIYLCLSHRSCNVAPLFTHLGGSTDFTIPAPKLPGVIEVTVSASVAGAGAAASDTKQQVRGRIG